MMKHHTGVETAADPAIDLIRKFSPGGAGRPDR